MLVAIKKFKESDDNEYVRTNTCSSEDFISKAFIQV
jgi:hypothetical protein